MKTIKLSVNLIGFFSIILLSSCSKNFLDKNPTDRLNATTFYTTKSAINAALTSCYSTLQDEMFTSGNPYYDCLSDNGYAVFNTYSAVSLSQGPINPTSGGYIDKVYSQSYTDIARYNIFLKTLADYTGKDLSESDKSEFAAEAQLMRAMKYFVLYKFYGEVPLVLEPLTVDKIYQPKADSSQIKAQILSDIDFAIANLPNVSYATNNGHLVKAAAEVLKARVLLYDAYNDDGTAKKDVMSQVKTITEDIIASNFYKIAPSFRGLFCDDLGQQEGNPEFIFSVKFLAPDNQTSYLSFGQAAEYIWYSNIPAINPLVNFANEFEFIDGTPFSTSNPLYNPSNVYENRDPRMSKTIFTDTVTFENGFTAKGLAVSATGYSYYKHITGTDAADIYGKKDGSDWPSMRYAEVLLMYAEAANEVDGPTPEVYSAINQIRSRADVLMPPLPAGLTQDQMRNSIRHERRIELAFEGFRYDDLKRWKIADKVLNMPATESVIPKTFLKKNYHLPLPQSEIDKNHGILVQNPDY
jgi:hypothetical protein